MIRLAVRVARDHAELVLAELLELAPAGVEELDGGDGTVEYAIYGSPGELPSLPDVNAVAGDALVEVSTSELPDDWSERWRQFHRPVLIRAPRAPRASTARVPDLHIRPPWERPPEDVDPEEGRDPLQIVIDPGQAFGTGAHATTRLCLELLLEVAVADAARGALVDVGTGSGVLAIAAALLGYGPVVALDNEPESVMAAADNARVNAARIEARPFDLRKERPPPAPVVTANLLRPLLLELAAGIEAPPSHLIAGGLLVHECDEVGAAFAAAGMGVRTRRDSGEWAALWLTG